MIFYGLRAAVLAVTLVAIPVAAKAQPASFDPGLSFSPIDNFRIGSSQDQFGPLRFVGGFEMAATDRRFGQVSGFRFVEPGGAFLAVADQGYWFSGGIARDAEGRPVGVDGALFQPMVDGALELPDDKHRADAEGLAVEGERVFVSFERDHRVEEYALSPGAMADPVARHDILIPLAELRYNAGLETVIATDPEGPHEGALIVIAERSIDADGNIFAAVLDGPREGIFKVERTDGFDVTDGAMLPGGDLLLLERRFTYTTGVAMRIRRIAGDDITAGALVSGDTLYDAGMTHRIDNLEGLDLWRRDDGATMVSIVSDDNQSFLQRTLYLEFELTDEN